MRPCCKTRRPGKRKVYGREKAQTEKRLFGPCGTHRACLRLHLSVRVACICGKFEKYVYSDDELQRTLDSGDEAAYMERIARDKLGYVLPGEHIYVDMSGD